MFILLFSGLILLLFVIGAIRELTADHRLDKKGIEAAAEVSRIRTEEITDYDGSVFVLRTYYVSYPNSRGETVVAPIPNPKPNLEVGSRVKIKYLPNRQKRPILIAVL